MFGSNTNRKRRFVNETILRVLSLNPVAKAHPKTWSYNPKNVPNTAKTTTSYKNEYLQVAVSVMQGWRATMEDAYSAYMSLANDPSASFFAVFDGHGGPQAANYLRENLHKDLQIQPDYQKADNPEALRKAFMECDWRIRSARILPSDYIGSTAITLLIRDNHLYCANAGDSRAVACVSGHVVALSHDHKPTDDNERMRIYKAGSWVCNGRVDGMLSLSRAFGDFHLKNNPIITPENQAVSAYPDVSIKEITEDLEFVVLACDGIWEVKSNSEVVSFIRQHIASGMQPEKIIENLMDSCIAKDLVGQIGFDNMSVILICFLKGTTYKQFSLNCAKEKRQKIDPYKLLTHFETGPPDTSQNTQKPKRQRRWGLSCFSGSIPLEKEDEANDYFIPAVENQLITRPIHCGRRATMPVKTSEGSCLLDDNNSKERLANFKQDSALPPKHTITQPNYTYLRQLLAKDRERNKTTNKRDFEQNKE